MEDWATKLQRGSTDEAWDLFLHRHRRLVLAAIRHYAKDYDAFAWVCEALREDDLRRLRAYTEQRDHRAAFSTWLVTVVRHLTIDWFRHHQGRRRLSSLAAQLPPLRRRIFELVFLEQRSHVEAYELLRSTDAPDLSFRAFITELRETYSAVTEGRRGAILRELGRSVDPAALSDETLAVEAKDRRALLEGALDVLDPVDRVAVMMFVVEDVPAADVARLLGLANAKAVYNRVYRALALVRQQLERAGITHEDL
jgi:RNA polymerase sigma factor (sigma-70 family)